MKQFKHRFQVNPLTANQMNHHYKKFGTTTTKEYKAYMEEVRDELAGVEWPFEENFVEVTVHYGVSNRGKDLDNLNKPLLDTLQKVYPPFNDNKVYRLECFKHKVKRGDEYIDLTIGEMDENNNT